MYAMDNLSSFIPHYKSHTQNMLVLSESRTLDLIIQSINMCWAFLSCPVSCVSYTSTLGPLHFLFSLPQKVFSQILTCLHDLLCSN